MLERLEGFRVAEKTRDADQHVRVKRVEFLGIAPEKRGVVAQRALPVQHHAPGDAALDGARFVEGEIDPAMIAQQEQNFPEPVLLDRSRVVAPRLRFGPGLPRPGARTALSTRGQWIVRAFALVGFSLGFGREPGWFAVGARDERVLRDPRHLFCDGFRREHKIDATRGNRAARHRVELGRFILGKRDATFRLDRFQAERPVRSRAGKDHPDRALAAIDRERFKKAIDRMLRAAHHLVARLEFQDALANLHPRVRWDHINVIRFDPEIIPDLVHGHGSRTRQNLGQRAFVHRVEMLHQHETHPGVRRQMF